MKEIILKTLDMAWRVLLVAAGYALALLLAGVILGMAGLLQAGTNALAAPALLWMFVGVLIMSLMLGLTARRLPATPVRHVIVWSILVYANVSAVTIEGIFFAPDLVSNGWITILQQLLPSLVTAVLVYYLFAPRPAVTPPGSIQRTWFSWVWRFALSAFIYLVAYWVFGGINFALVTRPYYEALGSPLAVPDPQTVLRAEMIRAVLIVLSVVPFLLTARMSLRRLVIWSGLLLFVIGGIVPLTWQAGSLAPQLLLASAVEIFFQNFTTGAAAALLLARPASVSSDRRLRPA